MGLHYHRKLCNETSKISWVVTVRLKTFHLFTQQNLQSYATFYGKMNTCPMDNLLFFVPIIRFSDRLLLPSCELHFLSVSIEETVSFFISFLSKCPEYWLIRFKCNAKTTKGLPRKCRKQFLNENFAKLLMFWFGLPVSVFNPKICSSFKVMFT